MLDSLRYGQLQCCHTNKSFDTVASLDGRLSRDTQLPVDVCTAAAKHLMAVDGEEICENKIFSLMFH